MEKLHELVGYLKLQALELGRTPTKFEFISQYGNEHFLKSYRYNKLVDAAGLEQPKFSKYKPNNAPKILFLDIELAPMNVYTWGLFDQNIGLNQIVRDWFVLSWAAKWVGSKEIHYMDVSEEKEISNDKKICKGIYKLLNDADIVITHNGDRFDLKKLNARFIVHDIKPPSHFRSIDTLRIARKKFGFTSNKLEYLAKKLTSKRKMTKRKFNGMDLWSECLKGNILAWQEMRKYNEQDVLVLEDVYNRLVGWDKSINFSTYSDGVHTCRCGSSELEQDGYIVTNSGKYLRYICVKCGANFQDKKNLIKPSDLLKAL